MSSVDVIVPCYRYGHFLRECVKSVLTQSGPNVRVLVIDDASPDHTAEVAAKLVQEDSRVTFLKHTTNKGHIATYNEGIDWTSAKYCLLLSADDYLLPGALSRAVDLMDAHAEVGFTYGKAVIVDDSEDSSRRILPPDTDDELNWRILTGLEFIEHSGSRNIVPTPTAVVRTALQKKVGGYRPELPHSGDMEMWLRFAAHAAVGVLDAHQAAYRRHVGNMSHGYTMTTWLPDLKQRKSALDYFFQYGSQFLPNAGVLRRKLLFSLACEAIGFASTAFNDHQEETFRQMSEYALEISPEIRRSLPWVKLACKRIIGHGAWRALKPLVSSIRKRSNHSGYGGTGT
jgi:glycosyltransferase involved in cell wall biosynthesis